MQKFKYLSVLGFLSFTVFHASVVGAQNYGWEKTEIVTNWPANGLQSIRYAEGAYRLQAGNGYFKSENGTRWIRDPDSPRYFGGSQYGDLWFIRHDQNTIYTSTDQIKWQATNARESKLIREEAGFAYLTATSASAEGNPVFGISSNGHEWMHYPTSLPSDAELMGYVGNHWLACVEWPALQIWASANGSDWQVVELPEAVINAPTPFTWLCGEGHLLLLGYSAADSQQMLAISTQNLTSWKNVPFFDGSGFNICIDGHRIITLEGEYWFLSKCFIRFLDPHRPYYHYAPFITHDFETFTATSQMPDKPYPPMTAFADDNNPIVKVQITSSGMGSIKIEDADQNTTNLTFAASEIQKNHITAATVHNGLIFATGPRKIYSSSDMGVTWLKEFDLTPLNPSNPPASDNPYSLTGFFALFHWNDSVWAATRHGENNLGQIWKRPADSNVWQPVLQAPPEEFQSFTTEGGYLIRTGLRNQLPFVDWSTDGVNWNSHTFVQPMDYLRIRFAKNTFWLVGGHFEMNSQELPTQGWVMQSDDLQNWTPAFHLTNRSFRDIADANGTLILTERSTAEIDYPQTNSTTHWSSTDGINWQSHESVPFTGDLLTPLPDGRVANAFGYVSSNGVDWQWDSLLFDKSYVHMLNPILSVSGNQLLRISQIPAKTYSQLQLFQYIPVADMQRKWTFARSESQYMDRSATTSFGFFHHLGVQWYYHENLGALKAPDNQPDSNWFWSSEFGWVWLDEDLYPYVISITSGGWNIHYMPY